MSVILFSPKERFDQFGFIESGPVDEEMFIEGISIFISGLLGRAECAVVVKGIMGNIHVKLL